MTPGTEPVRLAVIASSDDGGAADAPLLFAESDALRVGKVLNELGGFSEGDVWLVPDATVDAFTAALGEAVVRSAQVHAAGRGVELWVYYTGHAGADGLHLGGEVLAMSALKTAARVVPAERRVFVVDACQSGQILRSKGATLVSVSDAPAEFVPPPDEAWIASAGAEESAFEVDRRRGALFTHFFVSGARGAADADADGVVTLAELYGFVHAHTAAEAAGLGYVQEPRWAGALGDVVVSSLDGPSGVVAQGPVQKPLLLVDERRGEVVAEIPSGAGARIAVRPGRYQVVALGGDDRVEVGTVEVPAEGWATTGTAALREMRGVRTRGGLVDTRSDGLVGGVSLATGRSPGARVGPGAFLEWRRAVGRGVDLSVGALASRTGFVTDHLQGVDTLVGGQLGARVDVVAGGVRLGPTADVASGALHQVVQRAPDPVWGRWYGTSAGTAATTVPWVALHGGVGLDVPAGPAALVMSGLVGPAVQLGVPLRAVPDLAVRVGFEWGAR